MPSSLSLFISSFPLKVRDMRLYLEVLAGLFISLISVSFQRRERKSGERFCSSAVRIHTRTKFLVSRGHSSQGPKTATVKPPWPLITDHNSKCSCEKLWNTVRITKMWHRDVKWAGIVGKMVPTDLLKAGLSETFNLWKMQYLQSTVKLVMPVYAILFCLHASKRIFSKNLSKS